MDIEVPIRASPEQFVIDQDKMLSVRPTSGLWGVNMLPRQRHKMADFVAAVRTVMDDFVMPTGANLTDEEKALRSLHARMRFKAAIRFVMANIAWLDDVEDQELGDDVKRNIALLKSKRKGYKKTLSIFDKSILSKPTDNRTEEEKNHLFKVIGSLKCFRRYPPHVKKELAGVTYFKYYGPGRVIYKQSHLPYGMYFVLSGEICVSQMVFDAVLKRETMSIVGTMEAGMIFGEVALLHGAPRTSTCTTGTQCELLCVMKDDFDRVLKATIQEQWDTIRNSLLSFSYFQDWDEVQIRECCILSKLRSYHAQQTIFGDGLGVLGYVHFILKGQCQVIEHLLIRAVKQHGKMSYSLYQPEDEELDVDVDTRGESQVALGQKPASSEVERVLKVDTLDSSEETPVSVVKAKAKKSTPKTTSIAAPAQKRKSTHKPKMDALFQAAKNRRRSTIRYRRDSEESEEDVLFKPLLGDHDITRVSLPFFIPRMKTVFMQVCILNQGACFGIGETQKSRRVIALTNVEMLLIPRYWLMIHNKANIWTRIRQFLETQTPTTKKLFEEFLEYRKWLEYRRGLVSDILAKNKYPNSTTVHDVPYSIRMHEDVEF